MIIRQLNSSEYTSEEYHFYFLTNGYIQSCFTRELFSPNIDEYRLGFKWSQQ